MLKLAIKTGAKAGKTVTVEDRARIGRSQDNELFLPDPQISRFHAEIRAEDDEYWIEDAGSYNGTLVNEIRVEKRPLRDGDVILVGNTELQASLPTKKGSSTNQRLLVTQELSASQPMLVRSAEQMALPELDRVGLDNYLKAAGISDVHDITEGEDAAQQQGRLLRQAQQFAVLYDAAMSMQKNLGLDDIVDTVGEYVLQVFKVMDFVNVVLMDPETSELVPILTRNRKGITQDDIQISNTIISEVINSKRAVPMITMERVIGLVQVTTQNKAGVFSEEDMFLLTVLASLAATAIENSRLMERQRRTIDELREAQTHLLSVQERLVEQERLASVGQLASGIAHEIRNMLGPIMLAEMIQQRYPDDNVIREYSDTILESHKRILGIVGEVRAFSSGQGPQHNPEPTILGQLVNSVVRFLRYDREVKEIPIDVTVEQDLAIDVDGDKLKQILINLIRNAVQAVEKKDGRVNIQVGCTKDRAFIQIVDNGTGISDEHLEQIWKPFFTTKEGTGTGLGLHVSKTIVERHGGTLECTSVPGKGTRMTIWLPVTLPTPLPQP